MRRPVGAFNIVLFLLNKTLNAEACTCSCAVVWRNSLSVLGTDNSVLQRLFFGPYCHGYLTNYLN
jgi:hypothetical protein